MLKNIFVLLTCITGIHAAIQTSKAPAVAMDSGQQASTSDSKAQLSTNDSDQQVAVTYTAREQALIDHIKKSIQLADQRKSKISKDIFAIEDFSSDKVRCLLNQICSLPKANYLQIGVFHGATLSSALYGNSDSLQSAIAIDDWAGYGGKSHIFPENCKKHLAKNKFKFYEENFFTINKKAVFKSPVNIYFYDGDHSVHGQSQSLTYYDEVLDDLFILVVDDWNHGPTKEGTFDGMSKLNYQVLYSVELPADYNGDRAKWWNGIYVALVKKPK